MAKTLTVQDFFKMFADDDACLAHLFSVRFGSLKACPKCLKVTKFHKLAKAPAYACQWCGHHIHPMKGTPFASSHTPLQKWFYAMYLFTTTRHGVPAKELQRQLSVTYKTAWRMAHEIRKYMAKVDGDPKLQREVEIDETYVGGESKGAGRGRWLNDKTVVFGILERDGNLMMKVVPDAQAKTLVPIIEANVEKPATIHSDTWPGYRKLAYKGYDHQQVNHRDGEYVRDNCHTNAIENVWSQLKRSIRGTHVHVSAKHLDKYLCEFEYRFNRRKAQYRMFSDLLEGFCT